MRRERVLDPFLFCAPADKNGEGMQNPVDHLTCYHIDPEGPVAGPRTIENQLSQGIGAQIQILEQIGVCAPALKFLPEPGPNLVLAFGALALYALERRRRID